jgi:putative NADH-flavin reductase
MGDKETLLKLLHSLTDEVSHRGIENTAVSREKQQSDQMIALRKSIEAATILAQALEEHQSHKNGLEN